MTLINDIIFSISSRTKGTNVVEVILELKNNSPNDYLVSKDVIWLGNTIGTYFEISGPSVVPCTFSSSSSKSSLILIKSGFSIKNLLTISDICIFEWVSPGIYSIKFSGIYYVYNNHNMKSYLEDNLHEVNDYAYLIGNSTFVIGDNPEDIALKSLTYESGL